MRAPPTDSFPHLACAPDGGTQASDRASISDSAHSKAICGRQRLFVSRARYFSISPAQEFTPFWSISTCNALFPGRDGNVAVVVEVEVLVEVEVVEEDILIVILIG